MRWTAIGGTLILAATGVAQPAAAAPPPLAPAVAPQPGQPDMEPEAPPWRAWPLPDPSEPSPYRSNSMRITGIVLISLASGFLLGGALLMSLDLGSPHGSGRLLLVTEVPLMLTSTVFAGVGIPLWVVGARRPPSAALSVGLGTARLTF